MTSFEVGSRPSAKAGGPAASVLIHIAVGPGQTFCALVVNVYCIPATGETGKVDTPF